jgi:hypothetical protein
MKDESPNDRNDRGNVHWPILCVEK